MTPTPDKITLAGDLGSWVVLLASGGSIHLTAHAYSQTEDEYIFVALAEGDPRFEIELARIPRTLVNQIHGGLCRDADLGDCIPLGEVFE
jgi:hypothetical protein